MLPTYPNTPEVKSVARSRPTLITPKKEAWARRIEASQKLNDGQKDQALYLLFYYGFKVVREYIKVCLKPSIAKPRFVDKKSL